MATRKVEISNTQNGEIRPWELTTLELDAVCGGLRNNQTAWWAAVRDGITVGRIMAGATVECTPGF
jgi:hypothetical protein